jgi:hypothetical protein
VVGHNQWDVDWQLSGAPPVQEVVKAMTESGDEDRYALPVVNGGERPLDTEGLCDTRKLSLEKSLGDLEVVEANLDPHKEALRELIPKLLTLHDVAPVVEEEAGDRMHDPWAIRTRQGKHNLVVLVRFSHAGSPFAGRYGSHITTLL